VFTAAFPGEALEAGKLHAIDLLVTDVVMPQMSGRELADTLKQKRPSLQVLFMSGYTPNAIAHHGVLDAGLDFIAKPFAIDAFSRKVDELLARR
jgi:CheY-like chemotaxis protein